MDFEKITKIIDDIVAFIKSAVANMKKFINGFKNDLDFEVPSEEVSE